MLCTSPRVLARSFTHANRRDAAPLFIHTRNLPFVLSSPCLIDGLGSLLHTGKVGKNNNIYVLKPQNIHVAPMLPKSTRRGFGLVGRAVAFEPPVLKSREAPGLSRLQ